VDEVGARDGGDGLLLIEADAVQHEELQSG
jgi:hypothetical protein